MNTQTPLMNMSLRLFLGAAGQIVRAVSGLRKNAVSPGTGSGTAKDFSWSRFGLSIILVGTARMVAALVLWDDLKSPDKNIVLGLLTAGYAGSTFLESVKK